MKYIIVDLEATCWQKKQGQVNEIIEIGAVCIDDNKKQIGEFVQIIRPTLHPTLSDFCTGLTSITQEMVDEGVFFPEGLNLFLEWIHSFQDDYLLGSWGNYDRLQFEKDCIHHQLPIEWLNKHISVKHQYAELHALKRPIGMKGALKREQFVLEGTHHRGIDDAKNIAKIFVRYFDRWKK